MAGTFESEWLFRCYSDPYCQCGKHEPRHFREVEKMQARGASVAAASPVIGRSIVGR